MPPKNWMPRRYRKHSVPPNRIPAQLAAPSYREQEAPAPAWEASLRARLASDGLPEDGFGGIQAVIDRAREARERTAFAPAWRGAHQADPPAGWPWCDAPAAMVYMQPGTNRRRLWEPWEVEAREARSVIRELLQAARPRVKGDYTDRPNLILEYLGDSSTPAQLVTRFVRL